ncbi:pectin lyase fold/virulence factor [Vibrio phage 1.189.C._10N.286.51.B5]|nr:pectin lyase fold/virulence factor [Vibrio phage 1.189.C._10N.286.51.B5]
MSCEDFPTIQTAKTYKLDAETTNEVITLDSDRTSEASDGKTKKTFWGIEKDATNQLADIQQRADEQYSDINNQYILRNKGDYATDPLLEFYYEFTDFNGLIYFPIVAPYQVDSATYPDPSSDPNLRLGQATDDSLITATGSTTPRRLDDRFADTVNAKDFGAIGGGVVDDTAAIQAAIDTGRQVILPSGDYAVSSLLVDCPFRITGAGRLLISGNISLTDNCTSVHIENISIVGGGGIITATSSSIVGMVRVNNLTMQDCQTGIHLLGRASNVVVQNSTFLNLHRTSGATSCQALRVGNNVSSDAEESVGITFDNNFVSGVLNDFDTETHAVLIHGRNVHISNNHIENVYHSFERACEAIYLKSVNSTVTGNTILDCGPSDDGCISVKGTDYSDASSPSSFENIIQGNTVRYTSEDKQVIGVSAQSVNSTVSNNTLYNCYLRLFSTERISAVGNVIDITSDGIFNFCMEISNASDVAVMGNTFMIRINNFTANTFESVRVRNTSSEDMSKVVIQDNKFITDLPDLNTGANAIASISVWSEVSAINDALMIGNEFSINAPQAQSAAKVAPFHFQGAFGISSTMKDNIALDTSNLFIDTSTSLNYSIYNNVISSIDVSTSNLGLLNNSGVTITNTNATADRLVYPENAIPGAKLTVKCTHPAYAMTVNTVGTGQFYDGSTTRIVSPGETLNMECVSSGYWLA